MRYPEYTPDPYRTFDVVGLCKQMRESDDYSALPILADALEEAGYPGTLDLAWLRLSQHDADDALCFVVYAEGGEAKASAEWIDLEWAQHFYAGSYRDDWSAEPQMATWVRSVRDADQFLKEGSTIHLNYDTPDVANSLEMRKKFWEHYQRIRGKVETRKSRWDDSAAEFDDEDGIYRCSC